MGVCAAGVALSRAFAQPHRCLPTDVLDGFGRLFTAYLKMAATLAGSREAQAPSIFALRATRGLEVAIFTVARAPDNRLRRAVAPSLISIAPVAMHRPRQCCARGWVSGRRRATFSGSDGPRWGAGGRWRHGSASRRRKPAGLAPMLEPQSWPRSDRPSVWHRLWTDFRRRKHASAPPMFLTKWAATFLLTWQIHPTTFALACHHCAAFLCPNRS